MDHTKSELDFSKRKLQYSEAVLNTVTQLECLFGQVPGDETIECASTCWDTSLSILEQVQNTISDIFEPEFCQEAVMYCLDQEKNLLCTIRKHAGVDPHISKNDKQLCFLDVSKCGIAAHVIETQEATCITSEMPQTNPTDGFSRESYWMPLSTSRGDHVGVLQLKCLHNDWTKSFEFRESLVYFMAKIASCLMAALHFSSIQRSMLEYKTTNHTMLIVAKELEQSLSMHKYMHKTMLDSMHTLCDIHDCTTEAHLDTVVSKSIPRTHPQIRQVNLIKIEHTQINQYLLNTKHQETDIFPLHILAVIQKKALCGKIYLYIFILPLFKHQPPLLKKKKL